MQEVVLGRHTTEPEESWMKRGNNKTFFFFFLGFSFFGFSVTSSSTVTVWGATEEVFFSSASFTFFKGLLATASALRFLDPLFLHTSDYFSWSHMSCAHMQASWTSEIKTNWIIYCTERAIIVSMTDSHHWVGRVNNKQSFTSILGARLRDMSPCSQCPHCREGGLEIPCW